MLWVVVVLTLLTKPGSRFWGLVRSECINIARARRLNGQDSRVRCLSGQDSRVRLFVCCDGKWLLFALLASFLLGGSVRLPCNVKPGSVFISAWLSHKLDKVRKGWIENIMFFLISCFLCNPRLLCGYGEAFLLSDVFYCIVMCQELWSAWAVFKCAL